MFLLPLLTQSVYVTHRYFRKRFNKNYCSILRYFHISFQVTILLETFFLHGKIEASDVKTRLRSQEEKVIHSIPRNVLTIFRNKQGTPQVGDPPLKVQKEQSVLNMRRNTIVTYFIKFTAPKLLEASKNPINFF